MIESGSYVVLVLQEFVTTRMGGSCVGPFTAIQSKACDAQTVVDDSPMPNPYSLAPGATPTCVGSEVPWPATMEATCVPCPDVVSELGVGTTAWLSSL